MADEDEVDVLGDFTFDNLFPKEDSRISACYDGGVHSTDQLLHDCINPAWLLEPSQPCWFSPNHDDRQRTSPASADDRSALGFPNLGSAGSPSHWEEQTSDAAWSEREKSLLDKGIELFGRSWSRVAQFVGTKSPQAVRTQARVMGLAGVSSVSESSEVQEEEEVVTTTTEASDVRQPVSFNFSELIDDMAIPASIEEVIAVVTTAQPTVQGGSALSPPVKRQRQLSSSENTKIRTSPFSHIRVGGQSSRVRSAGDKGGKRGRPKKHLSEGSNHTITNHDEVNTIPIAKDHAPFRAVSEGEQLVRIQKENEESEESEIEIDDTDDVIPQEGNLVICETPIKTETEKKVFENFKEPVKVDIKSEPSDKVFDLPQPKREVTLDPDVVSEEEKEIHYEFFQGRIAKTPSRYLKIRNHIVDCWDNSRPRYVSKTSVRAGLRNCGDVNCIGRIHAYLEMVGAINFGCEQTQYRPIIVAGSSRGGGGSAVKVDTKPTLTVTHRAESARPRKKKPEYLDSDGEGGYTISHDGSGGVVYTKEPRRERRSAHEQLRLVYCHRFSEFTPAPYSVVLDVGALLLMDVHSHACRSEVIGLLGGSYDSDAKVLHISRGVACRSQSTGVQCDMCPVSQTEASERLQDAGLEVVGWYHSHPTFLPNPSLQDLDTQLKVQTWFDKTDLPFVGIIVSPYFHGNKSMASSFKCLIVREDGEERKPYQFPVRVSAGQTCSDSLVTRIADVFRHLGHGPGSEVVPFNDETASNPPATFLQKLVESLKIHMERCQPIISPEERANLIAGIMNICQQNCSPG